MRIDLSESICWCRLINKAVGEEERWMTASCCLLYLAGVSLEGGRGAWSLIRPDCGLGPSDTVGP